MNVHHRLCGCMWWSPLSTAARHAATAHFASQRQSPSHRDRSATPPPRSTVTAEARPHTSARPPSSSHASSRPPAASADHQLLAMRKELEATQRELREVRLQLAQQQKQEQEQQLSRSASTKSSRHPSGGVALRDFATRALQQLAKTDEEAQAIAAELRYTGMALQCSQDRLEVELRRLLAIGLTAEDVDDAAIEAGARRYIRANIGYRVEHVSEEVAPTVDVAKSRQGVSTTSTRL